jgi:hypothetical protein
MLIAWEELFNPEISLILYKLHIVLFKHLCPHKLIFRGFHRFEVEKHFAARAR